MSDGTWVKRKADEHVCNRPFWERDAPTPTHTGDVWKCDECGTHWVVKVSTDPRDGIGYFNWEKAEAW